MSLIVYRSIGIFRLFCGWEAMEPGNPFGESQWEWLEAGGV